MIENGFVHIPARADWLDAYRHELSIFPNGQYDDQVDSTSQALDWVKQGMSTFWFEEQAREEYTLNCLSPLASNWMIPSPWTATNRKLPWPCRKPRPVKNAAALIFPVAAFKESVGTSKRVALVGGHEGFLGQRKLERRLVTILLDYPSRVFLHHAKERRP
jgi:hypothetical protein